MRGFLHAGCFVLLLVVGVTASGCGESSQATSAVPTATPSPAYMLAALQTGSPIDSTDPLVSKFQRGLDALALKCGHKGIRLADLVVAVDKEMAKRGVHESYLDLLTHVLGTFPPGPFPHNRCPDIFAAYATLRIDGGSAAPVITAVASGSVALTPTGALATWVSSFHQVSAEITNALVDVSKASDALKNGDSSSSLTYIQRAQTELATAQHDYDVGPLPPPAYTAIDADQKKALIAFIRSAQLEAQAISTSDSTTLQDSITAYEQGISYLSDGNSRLAKVLGIQ